MKTLLLFFATFAAFAQVRDTYPRTPSVLTVATLPASPATNTRATVSDGANSTDCTTGGGSTVVDCRYNGSAWVVAPGGSGGSSTPAVLWAQWETSGMAQALTRYVTIGTDQGNATETVRQQNLHRAGTLRNFYVRSMAGNVGGSGQTLTATVRINEASTSITCTINSGASTCNDTSNSAAVSAGDRIAIMYVTSATTGTLFPAFTLGFE